MEHEIEIKPLDEKNIKEVSCILSDWLTMEEVTHYIESIREKISDSSLTPKFDNHFYVVLSDKKIIGMAGFRKPNPKLLQFATTKTPAELCMLYVAKEHRGGKGVGTALLNYITDQVKKRGYEELIVRSAKKFMDTGWGFYDKMGFIRIGQLDKEDSEKISQIWIKKIS